MQNRKITLVQQLLVGFFCLSLTVFHSVKSPVLCLETDGHVNIESNCDSECDIPKEDNHNDDCGECVDVQLWDYNSDTAFIVTSANFQIDFNIITHNPFLDKNIFYKYSISQTIENPHNNLPPFLKNTILLI
ncbi:MAG: hypothetical protein HN913_05270 [Candidatus Marinimicrobia bacterium]|jgi:hypothetical protein|nr:hypothetical protein [Candidatus Neomarinimicrobiota bacterium]MBT3693007.1 hypothetical protein [Candidatus Neomarinimicrobiota bacterium]MBT4144385.1 hypothetical protein [Candidatus Neomarinimicrobiota bacterium]MBT4176740.1 hypothetical protein [Candidatus Neomarinimicrobiota bacterium]MBT4593022.1 hypothetical protein [Candidatus Neomarinimicrobiota bacterium]